MTIYFKVSDFQIKSSGFISDRWSAGSATLGDCYRTAASICAATLGLVTWSINSSQRSSGCFSSTVSSCSGNHDGMLEAVVVVLLSAFLPLPSAEGSPVNSSHTNQLSTVCARGMTRVTD